MVRSNASSAPLYSTPVTVAVPSALNAYRSSYGVPSTRLNVPDFLPVYAPTPSISNEAVPNLSLSV